MAEAEGRGKEKSSQLPLAARQKVSLLWIPESHAGGSSLQAILKGLNPREATSAKRS